MAAKGSKPEKPACAGFPIMGDGAPDRELRPTVRFFCVPTWDRIFELEVLPMKKLLFIIPSVLLLLAAGTLVFCKHHAERTGLACVDIDL